MELLNYFKSYLEKALNIELILDEKYRGEGLPFFMYDLYDFHKIKLYKNYFVVIIDKGEKELTPENIKKQIEMISNKTGMEVIYVIRALTSFQRDRLIKYNINFVVPDNQMYLPHLKIDLREHFKSVKQPKKYLSPASQAIIILSILNNYSQLDSQMILNLVDYSAMSVSRSFKEISNFGIGKLIRDGKEKILHLPDDKIQIWDKSKAFLSSPIMQEKWIKHDFPYNNLLHAGLSALSQYSMIAPPKNKVYAIYKEEWYKLAKKDSVNKLIEPSQTESNIKLQVWRYPPDMNKNNNYVDKFSLYMSLKDEKDERVEQALEDILEDELNGYRDR